MIPDRCPWCGARKLTHYDYECGTYKTCGGGMLRGKPCVQIEINQLWRVRLALNDIGWIARMIEMNDHGQRDQIGTGGDTAQKVMGAWGR